MTKRQACRQEYADFVPRQTLIAVVSRIGVSDQLSEGIVSAGLRDSSRLTSSEPRMQEVKR